MELGFGFHPAMAAVRVWPTTAEPVIVGAGAEVKGRPAETAAVGVEVIVVERYPDRVAVARTEMVFPTSLEDNVNVVEVAPEITDPPLSHW
jgi:hypothetical protein